MHDADHVADGKGFQLVVRDKQRRGACRFQDAAHLVRQALAQVYIQVGERFVQQQQLRLGRQRACQRHALLLSAGQCVGVVLVGAFQSYPLQHFGHAGGPFCCGQVGDAEGHVVAHVQVREQGIVLKHHANAPLLRGHAGVGVADDVLGQGNRS